jgi:hypothetical protein
MCSDIADIAKQFSSVMGERYACSNRHSIICVFFIFITLMGMLKYCIVGLFLYFHDDNIEHFFMCLFIFWISS